MSCTKKIGLPFFVSEILPFDYSLFPYFHYACHYKITIWNILMKVCSKMREVKRVCRIGKILLSLSELLPLD